MPTDAAAPPISHAENYHFGRFRLDASTRALYRANEFIPLTPKAAEILLLLVQEAGRVVTRERMMERVWPGVIVEEGVIANNISTLRKVLDAEFEGEAPIATVARRGYRFAAKVTSGNGDGDVPATSSTAPAEKAAPIAERSTIVVCDFDNHTEDPIFDATLRQALALHLAQSPYLEVLNDRKLHSVLTTMGRVGQPVTGELALEICARAGAAAAITGSIFVLGDEYVIGLQAVRSTGEVLVTDQGRAKGKGEVLSALDRAAIGLRTKLGESKLSVMEFGLSIGRIATTSLEALKAYATGRQEWVVHGELAAKPHQLRAIELDPSFVSAHAALSIACDNMGQTLEARRYMQKAYELRARTTEVERLGIEAVYNMTVTGNMFSAIDALRVLARQKENDALWYGNLGMIHALIGQWDKALECAQRAAAIEPNNVVANNLAIALMALGRVNEARGVLEDAFARGLDPFYLHLDAYQAAFLRGDAPDMQRHVGAVGGRGGEEDYLIAAEADTAAYHGQFARARELTRRAIDSARRSESLEMAATWEAVSAIREAEIGRFDLALAGAASALETAPGRNVRCMAAFACARASDAARASQLADELAREFPENTSVHRYWLPSMHAALAMHRNEWKAAIDALEAALPVELSQTQPLEVGLLLPPYLRGLALLELRRGEDAARELLKIAERPGLIRNFVIFPLACRGAARAFALAGRTQEAAAMREAVAKIQASADIESPDA